MENNKSTLMGVFDNRQHADMALSELKEHGINSSEISVVVADEQKRKWEETTASPITESAVSGAATGGIIGGVAGLLVGVGALAIPGIGALLIGGPIAVALGLTGAAATTVSGAVTGAVAGGLVGALVGLGLPQETAEMYEKRVKAGDILIGVNVTESIESEAKQILNKHGAKDISIFNAK